MGPLLLINSWSAGLEAPFSVSFLGYFQFPKSSSSLAEDVVEEGGIVLSPVGKHQQPLLRHPYLWKEWYSSTNTAQKSLQWREGYASLAAQKPIEWIEGVMCIIHHGSEGFTRTPKPKNQDQTVWWSYVPILWCVWSASMLIEINLLLSLFACVASDR